MSLRNQRVLAVLLILFACGREAQDSSMPGMTAEEHSRMQVAQPSGATDTAGGAPRSPIHLTPDEERALGVVYTLARRQPLSKTIRTVGRIEAPEPAIADVTPKIEGFVEQLFVDYTGVAVRRGQPLLELYSPMLVAAQEELVTARRLLAQVDSGAQETWRGALAILEAARRRLLYWDITREQIERVEQTGEVNKTLVLVSPVSGIVLEKNVLEGQQVMPGMRLYRIADLSSVWAEGDVFEQDLQFVRVGSQAHIEVTAYPGQHFMGRVSFVYPTVDEASRTNRVRVTLPNPGLRLKPGMYATIYLDVEIGPDAVVVPREAVVATGERNLVFVRDAEGMLVPREVVLGARAGDLVQVLSGLAEGETVVAAANFLVDAESRLAGTERSMPGMQHGSHAPPPQPDSPGVREGHGHD